MRSDTFLEVNLKNLEHNFELIRHKTNQEIIFMVKADAYGHGLVKVSEHAYRFCEIRSFGVADIGEAKVLDDHFRAKQLDDYFIYCFSNPAMDLVQYKELYESKRIIPVIESIEVLENFLKEKKHKRCSLVIKFDTGMNRLGIGSEELSYLIQILKQNDANSVDHVMTHFSNSYLPVKAADKTSRQLEQFNLIISELERNGIKVNASSCSNSGAIEQGIETSHTHIRPGLMVYGPQSFFNKDQTIVWEGRNLSTFKTRVLKTKAVKRGAPIGYGSCVTNEQGFITYLPVGYGDGILTYYSGSRINFNNCEYKIFGRVNMDLCALFSITESALRKGDVFSFWNEESYSVNQFANAVKTSAYQVMCAVGQRVGRIYI